MSNFVKTTIDFGTVAERGNVSVLFVKTPGCKVIRNIVGSCGCAVPKEEEGGVKTTFFAGNIADQIIASGGRSQQIEKTLSVYFTDGSGEVLTLKGKIVR